MPPGETNYAGIASGRTEPTTVKRLMAAVTSTRSRTWDSASGHYMVITWSLHYMFNAIFDWRCSLVAASRRYMIYAAY